MWREFFASGPALRLCFAWTGLLVFAGHAAFKAWLKFALNGWYEAFYDELQDLGSGAAADEAEHLAAKREAVWWLLVEFAILVSPGFVVHPVCKWISSTWRFAWRMALIRSYLAHYNVHAQPIEGSAQRMHEDTLRFEQGIYSCGTIVLDSTLTLFIFTPILLSAGAEARPSGLDWPPWLFAIAACAAMGGLGVSMLVGRRLVELEVANQKVEGEFRTNLVLLEQCPVSILPPLATEHESADEVHTESNPPACVVAPRLDAVFATDISNLSTNYRNLFRNFAYFNTWIALYDQALVLVPFLLVAPLMFAADPSDRITLGTLMKVSNAFDKVFGAMAVVTENWAAVNEWRSVLRRLSQFEASIYGRCRFDHKLLVEEAHAKTELASVAPKPSPRKEDEMHDVPL